MIADKKNKTTTKFIKLIKELFHSTQEQKFQYRTKFENPEKGHSFEQVFKKINAHNERLFFLDVISFCKWQSFWTCLVRRPL
jgi:hypothetical protein